MTLLQAAVDGIKICFWDEKAAEELKKSSAIQGLCIVAFAALCAYIGFFAVSFIEQRFLPGRSIEPEFVTLRALLSTISVLLVFATTIITTYVYTKVTKIKGNFRDFLTVYSHSYVIFMLLLIPLPIAYTYTEMIPGLLALFSSVFALKECYKIPIAKAIFICIIAAVIANIGYSILSSNITSLLFPPQVFMIS